MRPELTQFPNAEALTRAVAAAWLDEIVRANQASRRFHVALSGGRIAHTLFAEFSRQANVCGTALNQTHFFWADERCVLADDAESNYRVAREQLFQPLGLAETQIHRIRGELDPDTAARDAEAELRKFAPLAADGQPILDLILLGMGEDGHVASLFPGESATAATSPAIYRAVAAMKPPLRRVTLGYGAIGAARQVWVLIAGDGKEGALRESLRAEGRTPLARVLRSRTTTRVFTSLDTEVG